MLQAQFTSPSMSPGPTNRRNKRLGQAGWRSALEYPVVTQSNSWKESVAPDSPAPIGSTSTEDLLQPTEYSGPASLAAEGEGSLGGGRAAGEALSRTHRHPASSDQ